MSRVSEPNSLGISPNTVYASYVAANSTLLALPALPSRTPGNPGLERVRPGSTEAYDTRAVLHQPQKVWVTTPSKVGARISAPTRNRHSRRARRRLFVAALGQAVSVTSGPGCTTDCPTDSPGPGANQAIWSLRSLPVGLPPVLTYNIATKFQYELYQRLLSPRTLGKVAITYRQLRRPAGQNRTWRATIISSGRLQSTVQTLPPLPPKPPMPPRPIESRRAFSHRQCDLRTLRIVPLTAMRFIRQSLGLGFCLCS